MRTPTINWEAYKARLLALRYEEGKSLTDINKILFEELGRSVTNARLSQVFKVWRNEVIQDVDNSVNGRQELDAS